MFRAPWYIMKFRRQRSGGASTGAAGDTLDTDSAFSDDASSMLSSSESSTSSVNGGRVHQVLHLHPRNFCSGLFLLFVATTSSYPVVHFKVPYITSDLGPFLSLYITFESNIRDLWSLYVTFESNIQVLWSPYITLKIYTGSKLDPACAK